MQDTRHLYVIALIMATLVGAYYHFSGNAEKLENQQQNMTYSAEGILLTQSDEQGKLALKASVEQVQQNVKTQQTDMKNLQASVYENGQVSAVFSAAQGQGLNDNQKIVLSGAVQGIHYNPQGEMRLRTTELVGYPQSRTIQTDQVVTVDYPHAQFVSQGLKADLKTGQYDFFKIRGKYAPQS